MSTEEDNKYEASTDIVIDGGIETAYVDDVFVGIIGIDNYEDAIGLDNLKEVAGDIDRSVKLWNEYFGYDTLILSQYYSTISKRSKIYRKDVMDFLVDVRDKYNTKKSLKQINNKAVETWLTDEVELPQYTDSFSNKKMSDIMDLG